MYPRTHALSSPDKPAYIMGRSGEVVTYRDLDQRSSQGAHLFRSIGLRSDDAIAILMTNHPRFFEVCWAAQRSGLRYTPISTHLTPSEIAYILNDCGARALVASADLVDVAQQAVSTATTVSTRMIVGRDCSGFARWESSIGAFSGDPIDDETEGAAMLYSSGTTGYPKGVCHPVGDRTIGTPPPVARGLASGMFGFGPGTVYLSPAPNYHSAPLRFLMATQRIGATAIVMEKFDPRLALELIERHRVTHSQWVPTMFVRMLRLPEEDRRRYDLSSQTIALHAAAPCPVSIKREMIEWWGPILYEYYGATEGNGSTAITSEEWLRHPGSVGKPLNCAVHIAGDDGNELPAGEIGTVYFSGGGSFEYHNDPAKTEASRQRNGWSTVGDVGYLDEEGYLYLTDRKANMIISGGVNIYPQEAENVLIAHPKVADVAVFGIPNEDFGEEVKAVVQPIDLGDAGPDLEAELLAFCRAHLAKLKCPRSIDFAETLPRSESGKLYKRLIKDRYWEGHATRIV
jgi:acyl-CoA synthetase (AMP-forming)/AMP-acid ligase II